MPIFEECIDGGLDCLWVGDSVAIGVDDVGEVEPELSDL
jgi:hypothetical protein